MSVKVLIGIVIVSLAGCGGGGSGSSTESESSSNPTFSPQPQASSGSANANSVAVSQCQISTFDKTLLDAVNQARAAARVCGSKSMPKVAALTWNCTLADVASKHSEDMASNNFFSHTGSNGLSASNRVDNAGYEYTSFSENIAAGQITVDAVMTSWLGSEGHCKNIMSASVDEIGAARRINDQSDYGSYWTQVFGRQQ